MATRLLSPASPSLIAAIDDGWSRPVPALTAGNAVPSIAELVDVIGDAATERLCHRLGGLCREVGAPGADFVEAIGEEAAVKLRQWWGRGRIYIPRRAQSAKARHEEARRLADSGETRAEIAKRLQISERWVYNILARAEEKTRRRAKP